MVDFTKMQSGAAALDRFSRLIRFNIGERKQTKLNKVLGSRSERTLLTDSVSAAHAQRLFKQFMGRWGKLPKVDQLRFWTVLGSLAELEEKDIFRHIGILKQQLNQVLKKTKGVELSKLRSSTST